MHSSTNVLSLAVCITLALNPSVLQPASATEGGAATRCPPGVPQASCKADPCEVSSGCQQFPDALCKPDFCGGCYAKYYVGGVEVTSYCAGDARVQCPASNPVVQCLVNPCHVSKGCPGVPQATCLPNFCGGCKARFYVGSKDVTSQCQVTPKTTSKPRTSTAKPLCPPGVPFVFCFVQPCAVNKCPNYPNAVCKDDYCGGCHARFFVGDKDVTKSCGTAVTATTPKATTQKPKCPPGVPVVNCLVEPCSVTECANYPNARCSNDYCGGCNARFFVGTREVTKSCGTVVKTTTPKATPKPLCPPGVPVVNCLVEPCRFASCPKHPNAVCNNDYCGGCNARFFLGAKEVTASCGTNSSTTPKPSQCPPGVPIVNCFVEPCRFAKCQQYPNAECRNDYCGGCNARFYVGGKEVTKQCDAAATTSTPSLCPPGVPIVNCFVQPCRVTKCPKYPSAVCRDDYCGGCNARFYLGAREVTNLCSDSVTTTTVRSTTPKCSDSFCDYPPCTKSTCPAYPGARCENDCCGCRARYFVGEREITSQCNRTTLIPKCPRDFPLVQCLAQPCAVQKCPNHPTARCVDDYCGGCNARFYVGTKEVTDTCGLHAASLEVILGLQQTAVQCPDCVPVADCFREPCASIRCTNYPRAICVNNYCGGCNARFFFGLLEVTKSCQLEPVPETTTAIATTEPGQCNDIRCAEQPCSLVKCQAHPTARCVNDHSCGLCRARFFTGGKEVTDQCKPSTELCPNGTVEFGCEAFFCVPNACPRFPNAKCVQNLCGGCDVRFFLNGAEVTDKCRVDNTITTTSKPPACTENPLAFKCMSSPCELLKCDRYPNAECRDDLSCNQCRARFYVSGREVTNQCSAKPNYELCPNGTDPNVCKAALCNRDRCERFPEARCVQSICGGCNTRFFLNGKEVTSRCNEKLPATLSPILECKPGQKRCNPIAKPCSVTTCDNYPNATCQDDYCDGCRARFFHGKDEVTNKC